MQRFYIILFVLFLSMTVTSCRVAKHVADGDAVVSRVVIRVDGVPSQDNQLRILGTAPAIFDEETTDRTDRALQRVMQQQGYLDAVASHRVRIRNGKALVTYDIKSGRPRRLASIAYMSADTTLQRLIDESPSARLLQPGQLLDRSRLESERERMAVRMSI